MSRSDLTPRSGRGGDRLAAASPVPSRLVQRSGAVNHGPKIFHAYRFAPDHKLINLEAANAQLLSCGVADSETTHGHRAYRECTNGCRASGQCARGQRPQRNPAGGDAPTATPRTLTAGKSATAPSVRCMTSFRPIMSFLSSACLWLILQAGRGR